MIKAVLIDIDNTLLDFNKSSKQAIEVAFKKHNLTFFDEIMPVYLRITDSLWKGIEKGVCTRTQLRKDRWNLIFKELNVDYDGEKLEETYRKALCFSSFLIDGSYDLLEYLSKKYTVCTISNAPTVQQITRLKSADIFKFIDYNFISEDIGFDKPNKDFFKACFSRLGNILPEETIIVGDSLTADIKGGVDYNIKTVWVNFDNKSCGEITPTYTARSLSEIKNIL